jgi:hypothetical protein
MKTEFIQVGEIQLEKISEGEKTAIYIHSNELVFTDMQSALDLMATVRYEVDCDIFLLDKTNITEEFFDLSTRLAGEIAQKYVNYGVKLVIIGDFSAYTSKSLHDFIYECNNGKDLFFVSDREEALERVFLA